jgi:predicted nucleic acid-binding Zn ribbon protein
VPIYEYICKSCGSRCTLDRLPRDGAKMRHLVPTSYKGVSRVCGVFRRDWGTVNFNRVPGGGRG